MKNKEKNVINKARKMLQDKQIIENPDMSMYSSFKAGGRASILVLPESVGELIKLREICYEDDFPYFLMGNGTNILVRDEGYEGLVIKLGTNFEKSYVDGDMIHAQAGALLSKVSRQAAVANLTGLEFASGIPGSIGGGIYMNAGAYDGEIKDIIVSTRCIDKNGKILHLSKEDMNFAYRSSVFWEKDYIILEGSFQLEAGDEEEILFRMKELNRRRNEKQPVNLPSAGSTFKRPEGSFAGKLVEEAGLKGYIHGGASVSKLHAGFIVNEKQATATDIIELIDIVRERVFHQSGIMLEPEIRILGGAL
ncbi:MAG: UDP-N-acetylmuramate dehydrogenase [Eubacteriales bacterium]